MGEQGVDFAALFRAIPTPYLVMTPDLVIVDANPAYLANVGRTHDDIVGRHVFEAFPPAPDALDPATGVSRVQLSFEKALGTGRLDTMPIQKYDIHDAATGDMAVHYWSLISVPVPGADGRPALLVQRAEDITDFFAEREQGRMAAEEGEGWRRRVAEVEADLFARAQELQVALAAEEAAGRRLTSLAEVALELTTIESLEQLEHVVMSKGVRAVGAEGGAVTVPDDEGGWRLAINESLGEAATIYASLPWDSPLPAPRTARTGERFLMRDREAGLAVTPEMAGVHETSGRSAWAVLPLEVRGERLGSLAISWIDDHDVTPAELELLEGLAAQCAQALARLRARQAERAATLEAQRMSEVLQRSLLTSPPSPDALRISVRYQPSAEEAQVGGDWYDAFVTALGSTLLVVGDVNGHDQTAAATMGQIRNLLRGMAYDSDDSPAVLLNRLDAAMAGLDLDTLATAVLCRVEQSSSDRLRGVRRLRFSNAGHLPPLLRQPDGSVQVLGGEADLLLGFDPASPRGERVVELVEGCTLLLFTDGLVERRDAGIDDGIDRLVAALSEHGGGDPDLLCDALLRVVAPGGNDDDIALLVLRVDEEQARRSA